MKWQILFFNKKVEKETLEFPPKILAKLLPFGIDGVRLAICQQPSL